MSLGNNDKSCASGTNGAFGGVGINAGGVSIGVNWSEKSGWGVGISLGSSSQSGFNGSVGVGWSEKGGFGWNVGVSYTYTADIQPSRPKTPQVTQPKSDRGGVQSAENQRKLELIIWKDGIGHTATRVDEIVYGYYPTENYGPLDEFDFSPVKGKMTQRVYGGDFNSHYEGQTVDVFGINANDEQIKKVENHLKWLVKNPGDYSLTGTNCTSSAVQGLERGNIYILDPYSKSSYNNGYFTRPVALINLLQDPVNKNIILYHYKMKIKK